MVPRSGKITLGVLGGYTLEEGVDFTLRTGLVKKETFENFNPAGLPLLANIGIGYRH